MDLGDIFEEKEYCVINKELGRLVSYAYDLHQKDFKYQCSLPTFRWKYSGAFIPYSKKTANGGIYGWRFYRDHSSDVLLTQVGVFWKDEKGKDVSYFFETDNDKHDITSCKTKLVDNGRYFEPDIESYRKNDITSEEFVKAMVMLGFRREDVIAVAKGKMTAKEAFQHVAPDEIKNIEWLDIGRRKYVFDGNVAIEGNFALIQVDKFPFPFEGEPIFDCSKVTTCYMRFGENKRKAKLININANKESIKGTDLRTAIIDEPIDLSLVDATKTIFGHQVVIYPEHSIAPLSKINLALAVDSEGKTYVTDEEGHIKNGWFPETEEVEVRNASQPVKVYSCADTKEMAMSAIESGAEGIGLVRTENVFSYCDKVILRKFLQMYFYYDEEEAANVLKSLMKEQLEQILKVAGKKRVIIRLFDFKFAELLRLCQMNIQELEMDEVPCVRGTFGMSSELLDMQLDVLVELASTHDIELNVLIPMIGNIKDYIYVRNRILEECSKANITVKVGAMIENIFSMNYADELARNADFISIGTNDLTESITGLSRDLRTPEFTILSDQVKKAMEEIVYRVRAVSLEKEIGVCGEHVNYMENAEFLSHLNIDYVTCFPTSIKLVQEMFCERGSSKKVLKPIEPNNDSF